MCQFVSGLGVGDTLFNFILKIMRVLCGFFKQQRRVQFEVADTLHTITAIFFGSKWSCLLLRVVLQDALSEVLKIYVLVMLKRFANNSKACLKGRNKELAVGGQLRCW